ncbi:MAG: FxsA family protein [Deltaproteobacteria bacterium]|nr:FxsA family protein [Deltaproteobacteria bacterium]MBM4325133.1 FxsA family protein [Deltaproteobacteria bacterium]
MFGKLLFIFIFIPLVELMLLIEIGKAIGTLEVIMLTIVTGVAGAALAKWQGLSVLRKMQQEMAEGRMPASNLMDGVMILAGGILLLTPGVLTDLCGLFLLLPWTRVLMKKLLIKWMSDKIQRGQVHIHINHHL